MTTATKTFQSYLEGTDYNLDRAGMYFRLWRGETSVKGFRKSVDMAEFLYELNLVCDLTPKVYTQLEVIEADVIVYDCTGTTEEGAEFRHIQQHPINLSKYQPGNTTINGVYAACALPNMPTRGWHHGWCNIIGTFCPINLKVDRPTSYEWDEALYQTECEGWLTSEGINPHCLLSERPQDSVITKSQALELGFCFQTSADVVNVCVYRPDGTRFYADSVSQALEWISSGEHLWGYDIAPTCDLITRLPDNDGDLLNLGTPVKEVVIDPYQHLDPLQYAGWELVESPDGLIVRFDGYNVATTANLGYAIICIEQGYYLTGQCCHIAYSESPVNEFGNTELVCYPV